MYPILALLLPPLVPLLKARIFYFAVNSVIYTFAWLTLFLFPPLGFFFYVVSVIHAFCILSEERDKDRMRVIRSAVRANPVQKHNPNAY